MHPAAPGRFTDPPSAAPLALLPPLHCPSFFLPYQVDPLLEEVLHRPGNVYELNDTVVEFRDQRARVGCCMLDKVLTLTLTLTLLSCYMLEKVLTLGWAAACWTR